MPSHFPLLPQVYLVYVQNLVLDKCRLWKLECFLLLNNENSVMCHMFYFTQAIKSSVPTVTLTSLNKKLHYQFFTVPLPLQFLFFFNFEVFQPYRNEDKITTNIIKQMLKMFLLNSDLNSKENKHSDTTSQLHLILLTPFPEATSDLKWVCIAQLYKVSPDNLLKRQHLFYLKSLQ